MRLIYKTNSTTKYFQSVKPQHWTSKMQFWAVSGLGQWCFDGYINQLFGSCVNALTTDYEIRRNGPSPAQYFRPLFHPTHPHARPVMVGPGYAGGRLVGRLVVSNFPCYSGAQIHFLGDAHSKQWAALNASSVWAYLVDTLDNIHGLSIGINVLPGFWHIILACSLSTSAANGRDFTVVVWRFSPFARIHIH